LIDAQPQAVRNALRRATLWVTFRTGGARQANAFPSIAGCLRHIYGLGQAKRSFSTNPPAAIAWSWASVIRSRPTSRSKHFLCPFLSPSPPHEAEDPFAGPARRHDQAEVAADGFGRMRKESDERRREERPAIIEEMW